MDFNQLRLKHLQFKLRLRSLLYGAQLDEKPLVSELDCTVGRWICDQGMPACGHLPEMHRFEEVHTSLHLCMVKKMVENASGTIEVESRLGEGSTFRVYFPGKKREAGSQE